MNAADILKYGHLSVVRSVKGVSEDEYEIGGVCGYWSVKDLIGHLASFEHFLIEALSESDDKPLMTQMGKLGGAGFNDAQEALWRPRSYAELWDDYSAAQAEAVALVAKLAPEKLREVGAIPWYGPEYSLDDMLVYMFYGHKREHCGHIDLFRDRKKRA